MFGSEGIALTVVWECSRNISIFWWGLKAKFYLYFQDVDNVYFKVDMREKKTHVR